MLVNHHTDGLRNPINSRLYKYAADIAVCSPSPNDSTSLPAALQHVSSWASSNCLLLNHSECIECPFYLRVPSSLSTPLIVDGSPISQTNNVKYVGLTFSFNLTWSCHIESVFMQGQKICYALKGLRSAGAPREKLLLLTDSLLIPLIAYRSPAVFPGLLKQDCTVLRRLVSLVFTFTIIPYSTLVTRIVERHLLSTSSFCRTDYE